MRQSIYNMDMDSLTKITLVWDLYTQGVPKQRIAQELSIGRATVHRWIDSVKHYGTLAFFLDAYQMAKKGERVKRKVNPIVKQWVWQLREEHRQCCGQKIQYHLEQEYRLRLGVKTIYQILKEKYQLRTKWKKNQPRGPVPHASGPQEVVQMDTVDFGEIFAFTGVDIYSKEADIMLRPSLTSHDGLVFLETAMRRRFHDHVALLQTDGGPEFKEEFKDNVGRFADRHRVARPYKKNEQAYIESFNRSLRKECLGWGSYLPRDLPVLEKEIADYLVYYHQTRPHLSLNMQTPVEFLRLSHI